MDLDKTMSFKVEKDRNIKSQEILRDVYHALIEKGYNPINQIVGFLLTNDPGYISSYKDARKKMLSIDRASIVAILLKGFLK